MYFTECKVCGPFFRGKLTCNPLFVLCLTDQTIQYLLAPVVQLFMCLMLSFSFFAFFSLLSLFLASLGPKFNLPWDDCSLLLNLSSHMVFNCLVGTASSEPLVTFCFCFLLQTFTSAPIHHTFLIKTDGGGL